MNPHAEDILRRAACGELAPNSDELRGLLAADPEARQRLEELSAVSRALALAGADERRAIEEARAATTERDRERVAAALHAAAPSVRATPWWMRRSLWLAAAALVIGVAVGALALRTPRGGQRTVLSTDGYECLEPISRFDAGSVFRWRGTRPAGGSFEVVVCAENADGTRGKVLFTSERCETTSWTAPRERLAALPDAIVWFVRIYDSTGTPSKESPEARARRSSP